MAEGYSVRAALRAATADSHARVDALFSKAGLSDRDGYRRFLQAQAAAHLPIEDALDAAGAGDVLSDWPDRRRAPLLLADLAELNAEPPRVLEPPIFAGVPAILGGIYVLEGSRLGGAVLRRSVPDGLPVRFLGAGDSASWRKLLHVMEQLVTNPPEKQIAINAARRAFALFEAAAERFLKAK